MAVPYVDFPGLHGPLKEALLEAVGRVIDRGDYILGREVEEFEARFAARCGVPHAVAVNSGLDALVLSLKALGVGPGDEVITAPNSFVASAGAIALVGAEVVFADVRDDLNIDPVAVARSITPRTRALLPVHLTGRPADMEALGALAEVHELWVVEDAAQAVGARLDDAAVGGLGHVGCFSLHPLKNLGACGDGGVITTRDSALAEQLRMWRNHGLASRDDCRFFGHNSRLDTVQAAMLLVKLDHLDAWTARRRALATRYQQGLSGVPGLATPVDRAGEHAVYHTFIAQADRRDALRAWLAERDIGTAVHYPTPIHHNAAARSLGPRHLPVAEALADRIISLPIHPTLTDPEQDRVITEIRAFYLR